ncbi:ESX secretion-associated protein EspG [Prescottella subtropica]|uniref:ESX secretion-associated protein EspG n=1 Tax=Prescottella subtropica TaxID=2545757 RepID=UPI001F4F3367|nr:ESX secretion-associated protein EspG [Prescottella subtropica]
MTVYSGYPMGRPDGDARWRFTAAEFHTLWTRLGRDRLPYPLRYTPTGFFEDDLDDQSRAAVAAVLPRVTEDLHRRLTVLAEPDIRIEVAGYTDLDGHDEEPVRMHAGIRGGVGVLAVQTGDGDVHLSGVVAAAIPAEIASSLPRFAAGTRPALRFRRDEFDSGDGRLLTSVGSVGGRDAARVLLTRRRAGVGEITVFAGAAYDSRPTTDGASLHWVDVAGDGRYLLHGDPDVTVEPVTEARTTDRIARLVDAAEPIGRRPRPTL